MYCEACNIDFDGRCCPSCGSTDVREPTGNDFCFLTERAQIWADMLSDVLRQNAIPFLQRKKLGAGMALKTGPLFESVRFYVLYSHLSRARELVQTLFAAQDCE